MQLDLDGETIQSKADFHRAMKNACGISFYGENLDALWDLLTGLVELPVRISWHNAKQSQDAMGEDFWRIVDVINKAVLASSRGDFSFELTR